MHKDLSVPPQFEHIARSACLLLRHPTEPEMFAVCSRRNSTIDNLPGGKQEACERMAETASREADEEIGVRVDPATLQFLFADAIPGEHDHWVECFIAKSPTDTLVQKEDGITVKWTNWSAFSKNNAFNEYNAGVHRAYQAWIWCQDANTVYQADLTHLTVESSTASF